MTAGPKLVLKVVAGITSLDVSDRDVWADVAGVDLNDYGGLDEDERRALAPGHMWCMCLEPSVDVRERFLNSIDTLAVHTPMRPTMVAEVLGWLAVTGTDPRAEVDYVEAFTEIVDETGAVPEVPLTPERAAPFVDVLRGITSASEHERAGAARVVPELLPDLRPEEQWRLTGVLARAVVVEPDPEARPEQLRVLVSAAQLGALHAHDRDLVRSSLSGESLDDAENQLLAELGRP